MSNRIFSLFACGTLALTGLVGCNKSSEGGAPGTANSFKVSGPTMATTLKQGDKQTVTITLERGADFKQTVKLDSNAPKGLKVDFDKSTVKASDAKEVSLSITAEKDAPLGDHVVKVMAKPETGNETTVDVKVTVVAPK